MDDISVIIPTLNEELTILKTLDALSRLVNVSEVVVVDGGSTDKTVEIVREYQGLKALQLIETNLQSRGQQLHEGTKHAKGGIFWFVHADTRPTQGSGRQIKGAMKYRAVVGGNFEVIFNGEGRWARFLTWLYPQLRTLRLCYGDSAFFVGRIAYEKVGGFKDYPIFEDVDLYRRLQKVGRFVHLSQTVTTSSRRFENKSFIGLFLRWTTMQVLYWSGVSPRKLAKYYLPDR